MKLFSLRAQLELMVTKNEWKSVIIFLQSCSHSSFYNQFITWIIPDQPSLNQISESLLSLGVRDIYSVGSGCGLFEWILSQFEPRFTITGIEIDKIWWKSSYSIGPFIKTSYEPMYSSLNNDEKSFENTALMFCYFNNKDAFEKYLNWFPGNILVIIGPNKTSGKHCCPLPVNDPVMEKYKPWVLLETLDMEFGQNQVALYSRTDAN